MADRNAGNGGNAVFKYVWSTPDSYPPMVPGATEAMGHGFRLWNHIVPNMILSRRGFGPRV